MCEQKGRIMVTERLEWAKDLDELKRDYFYNDSRAEMIRTLVDIGISVMQNKPLPQKIIDQ